MKNKNQEISVKLKAKILNFLDTKELRKTDRISLLRYLGYYSRRGFFTDRMIFLINEIFCFYSCHGKLQNFYSSRFK